MKLPSPHNTIFLKGFLYALLVFSQATYGQISSHQINETIIGPSSITLDLDGDNNNDYQFEIITLSPGVLAARVNTFAPSMILDNSTFGYPDTLHYGSMVVGYFYSGAGVLGTFNNAGQFSGSGDNYLGIKLNSGGYNLYGWIKLNCSSNRDTLKIISCAYQTTEGVVIYAGEGDPASVRTIDVENQALKIFPNPFTSFTNILFVDYLNKANLFLYDGKGKQVMHIDNISGSSYYLNCSELPKGIYFVCVKTESGKILKRKILITEQP